MNASIEAPVADVSQAVERAPALGQPWQGGVYAGVVRGEDTPDYYLVVGSEEISNTTWSDATQWAKNLHTAGYDDWDLPNRRDGYVLWANTQDVFARAWYWLSTQCAGDSGYAWCQLFDDGLQLDDRKSLRLRARAVRRLPI